MENPPTTIIRTVRPVDYYLLWVIALLSLGMNIYIINILIQARQQVGQAAGTAAVAINELQGSSIDYPVEVHDSVPISMTLDYSDTVSVPISVTLPISTVVSVPLKTPIGEFPINVPVVTSIPVRLNPQVPLSVSIPVSVSVPIDVSVPIHVAIADTPLVAPLSAAKLYLQDLARRMGTPLPGVPPTPTPQ
jgi:hypothetical protein